MAVPVRIGVLGCAEIARRRMLPAMAASPAVELAAVASRDAARARDAAEPYGCRAVHGYRGVLADGTVDAVYVPLPAALHAEWVEAALLADKHVLAEKPLTTDPVRTAALLRLAAERGLTLMENVMFVHHAQHRAVRKLVEDDGLIGEPRSFRAEFTVPRRAADDIRHRPELGGGALLDTGVYPVRAALYFLGRGLEVLAASLGRAPGDRVDTSGAALLRTAEGVTAQLAFGLDHGYRSAYEFTGSEGRITVDRAFTPPADHRPLVRVERPSGVREIELAPDDQVANTLTAFADRVAGGAPADRADTLRQAELLAALGQEPPGPR